MRSTFLKYLFVVTLFFVVLALIFSVMRKRYFSVSQLGVYAVGQPDPVGSFYQIFFPQHAFPGPEPSFKFYAYLVDERIGFCIYHMCGKYGEFVETMGGWLFGINPRQPEVSEKMGLRTEDIIRPITSGIVISDQNHTVVGIYPNATIKDLVSILRRHPDLADFNLLKGVTEFGPLKVGEPGPLQPGDPVTYRMTSRDDFQTTTIPTDKDFYVFAIQKRFLTKGAHCTYLTCDYIAAEWVWPNGWIMNDGEEKTARLFGLDPKKVRDGEESLVVVMDSKGVVVALHPGKILQDTLSILRQLPEVYVEIIENP